jgi:Cu(I)/Ag(I) efflux system membrane protein CusA/SilA
VVTTYDRSDLILRALDTLKHELVLEMIVVSLVILLFLWHFPSAIVPIVTIPVSVLLSFIPLYLLGISVNIMTLAGIAISIGVLVDGAIVEVENAYNRLHLWETGGRKGDFHAVRLAALQEVGPSVFFSLLVIAVAFLPIFALVDQEGRLFGPLAWSKNLTMLLAAILAITLDPALRMLFARMDPFTFPAALPGEDRHGPPGRDLPRRGAAPGEPRHSPRLRPGLPVRAAASEGGDRGGARDPRRVAAALLPLGSEFMPPLNEGSILYMPTTLPGISVGEAQRAARDPGPDPGRLSRGGARLRQGRPRGHRRPTRRPSRCSRPPSSSSPKRVAGEGALVLDLAAGVGEAVAAPLLARPDLGRGARRRDERGARRCRASPTPGRCRSRRASTC